MLSRISTNLAVGLCALLLFAEVGFAQERNPTVYPYGGVPDKSRQQTWTDKPPLHFGSLAYFDGATFDSVADFSGATFDSLAYFSGATFADIANFKTAKFDGEVYFERARFKETVNFGGTDFRQGVDFELPRDDHSLLV